MRYTLVLLFGLLLVISPALGYFETGDSLKSSCSTDSDKCTGYISAVADTLGWTGCIPANVGPDTLRRIVLQYMNDHPEKARKVAFSVVTYALSEAYPCLVPYQKQALATRKPQAEPSAASSPSATQVLDIAPAGVSGADRRSLAIHLASVRTKDGAEIGWNNLQRQFPERGSPIP